MERVDFSRARFLELLELFKIDAASEISEEFWKFVLANGSDRLAGLLPDEPVDSDVDKVAAAEAMVGMSLDDHRMERIGPALFGLLAGGHGEDNVLRAVRERFSDGAIRFDDLDETVGGHGASIRSPSMTWNALLLSLVMVCDTIQNSDDISWHMIHVNLSWIRPP